MAHDAHHHGGPTAALRPCGLGFESDIYRGPILERLSTGSRFSTHASPRNARARSAEPVMSGYYHQAGDGLFPDEHGGPPPMYLEGIDPELEEQGSNASYGALYSTSTQGPPGAPFVTPPHDAFGFGFVGPYDTSSYPPMDHAAGYPAGNYPLPTMNPASTFSMGFDPSTIPAISGSGSATPFETPGSSSLMTSYHLSPNPTNSPPALSSRSGSPNSTSNLDEYGILQPDGTWTCAYPGCRSTVAFARPCDLRKHYHRHEKRYFCRHDGCERSETGARRAMEEGTAQDIPSGGLGYGTRKDRDRHERTHNPSIPCPIEGCHRRFARADNMRDHYKRIHLKGSRRR